MSPWDKIALTNVIWTMILVIGVGAGIDNTGTMTDYFVIVNIILVGLVIGNLTILRNEWKKYFRP